MRGSGKDLNYFQSSIMRYRIAIHQVELQSLDRRDFLKKAYGDCLACQLHQDMFALYYINIPVTLTVTF